MERKLYSLEAINSKNKSDRCIIKVNDGNRNYENKTYLSRIDQYVTTYFENKQQLLDYLKYKGFISDKYDDIKITYKYKGVRTLELEFNSNKIINSVSKNSKANIDLDKNRNEFEFVVNSFIKLSNDADFYSLILKSDQIPENLISKINQLNNFIDSDSNENSYVKNELINSIKGMLINYKVFRTVTIFVEEYTKTGNINLKQVKLPSIKKDEIEGQQKLVFNTQVIIEYDKEEKEEFLTEEEMAFAYKENNPQK